MAEYHYALHGLKKWMARIEYNKPVLGAVKIWVTPVMSQQVLYWILVTTRYKKDMHVRWSNSLIPIMDWGWHRCYVTEVQVISNAHRIVLLANCMCSQTQRLNSPFFEYCSIQCMIWAIDIASYFLIGAHYMGPLKYQTDTLLLWHCAALLE